MMRTAAVVLTVLNALVAVAAAQRDPAAMPPAMSSSPDVRVAAPTLAIPRNGSIVIRASAEGWPDEMPAVQVSKSSGTATVTFGGTMRRLAPAYWAWTANEALEPGMYDVLVAHSALQASPTVVTVIDDVAIAVPAIACEPMARVEETAIEHRSCSFPGSGVEQPFPTPFATRVAQQIQVNANAVRDADAVVSHQFLYRAIAIDGDDGELVSSERQLIAGPYREQASEYCFTVEAMDIATGELHEYPDTFCAAHGALGELTERALELSDATLNRFTCLVPPAGYEEAWCAANDQCLELATSRELLVANNCQTYLEQCPDASEPNDAGTDAGDELERDGGEGGEADASTDEAADAVRHGSGCAIRRVEQASLSGLAPVWLALLSLTARASRAPKLRSRRSPGRRA